MFQQDISAEYSFCEHCQQRWHARPPSRGVVVREANQTRDRQLNGSSEQANDYAQRRQTADAAMRNESRTKVFFSERTRLIRFA